MKFSGQPKSDRSTDVHIRKMQARYGFEKKVKIGKIYDWIVSIGPFLDHFHEKPERDEIDSAMCQAEPCKGRSLNDQQILSSIIENMIKSLERQIEESETTFEYVDEISVHEAPMKTPLAQEWLLQRSKTFDRDKNSFTYTCISLSEIFSRSKVFASLVGQNVILLVKALKKYTVDHFDSFIGRQLKFAVTDLMHYVKVSMETLRKEYKMFVKDPNRTLVFDNDHKFVPLNKKATSIKT